MFTEFQEYNSSYEKFVSNINLPTEKTYDVVIPVEYRSLAPSGDTRYLGHDATRVYELRSVYFIGKLEHVTSTQISSKLTYVILESWPLFLIAFSLTIGAGAIIWIAVSIFCYESNI